MTAEDAKKRVNSGASVILQFGSNKFTGEVISVSDSGVTVKTPDWGVIADISADKILSVND